MSKPLVHQIDAVRAITAALKKQDRVQLVMACGTGKTYVAQMVAEKGRYKAIVVFVPSLALVRQVLREFRDRATWRTWHALAVCSDETVAGEDETQISASEVGCDVTTSRSFVEPFLRQDGVKVVFCTYHSAPILAGIGFDLGVFDEAHKTAGNKDKAFSFALSDDNIKIEKRLFMTATPKHERIVDDKEAKPVFSMDDEQVYGRVAYRLGFRDAINRKLICGYEIVICPLLENVNTNREEAAQIALAKAMREYGAKRAFTFHSSIARAKSFAADRSSVLGCEASHVNGAMATAKRDVVLGDLAERGGIVTNVRCLSEGVDLPVVDMVGFIDAKESAIDIVQAVGRCLRRSGSKERGIVFVPVYVKVGETEYEAIVKSGFGYVFDHLKDMREQEQFDVEMKTRGKSTPRVSSHVETKPETSALGERRIEDVGDMMVSGLGKLSDVLVKAGGFGTAIDVVQAVKEQDEDLAEGLARAAEDGFAGKPISVPHVTVMGVGVGLEALTRAITVKISSVTSGINSADANKKLLIEMAKRGEPRPNSRTKIEIALKNYTGSGTFDSDFNCLIRKLAPHWFDSADANKKLLIEMAKRGEQRPHYMANLGMLLSNYICKSSSSYDPDFDRLIHKLAAQWFVNSADVNKKLLIEMAKRGDSRPVKSTKIGAALGCYTNKTGTYDFSFDCLIRKLAPQWFISHNNADANKKLLIEMAIRGDLRPAQYTKIGSALSCYTGKSKDTYDSDFDRLIRKLAPHWFKAPATKGRK